VVNFDIEWCYRRELTDEQDHISNNFIVLRTREFTTSCRKESYTLVLLARLNAERSFSDMFESIIGAIFVDSGGEFGERERFIRRMGLWRYMERLVANEVDTTHPKTTLARLAKKQEVCYDVGEEVKGREGITSYSCLVQADGVDIARVGGSLSKEEAVLRGSLKAADRMKSLGAKPTMLA